jgi:hypothetical protein
MFGAAVGAGVSEGTGASTGNRGISSTKGVVGGLVGWSSASAKPDLVFGNALNPFMGMSKPAVVSKPIFKKSRRLNPAAISSRLLLAAISFSFSRLLFLLETFAIVFPSSLMLVRHRHLRYRREDRLANNRSSLTDY